MGLSVVLTIVLRGCLLAGILAFSLVLRPEWCVSVGEAPPGVSGVGRLLESEAEGVLPCTAILGPLSAPGPGLTQGMKDTWVGVFGSC